MRSRLVLAAIALGALSLAARDEAAASFRFERPVVPGGPGANRLAPDVDLLTGAKRVPVGGGGGLEDLRLFDASGREVSYLLVAPPTTEPLWREGSVASIAPTKAQSGFEIDLGEVSKVDRFRLSGIRAPFLKRFRLEGSGDRVRWISLIAEGTLFDLPDETLKRTEAAFPASPLRYLRVTWDDRQSARVPFSARASARLAAGPAAAPPELAPLRFERRPSEPGKSRFRLHLPGPGLAVVAFDLEVSPGNLQREAEIDEGRLSGDVIASFALGRATLRRAEFRGLAASDLRIPVARPEEADLDLVVDDGDNPPLKLLAISAELPPLPWIYFESPDGGPLTARFGAPSLRAPRYDIEAMRRYVATRKLAEARWGPRRDLAPEAPGASAGELPAGGAPIDVSAFSYRREIPPSPPGLTTLLLDAAVLAHAGDIADARIADASGRQVPYILEKRPEPISLDLPPLSKVRPRAGDESRFSRYRLALPFATLPESRLVLSTSARVFERNVTVTTFGSGLPAREEEGSDRVLSRSVWRHAEADLPAPSLVLDLPPAGTADLEIEVDEGDNSPLPLGRPRLLLSASALRFFRPAGAKLRLLYGKSHPGSPRYDIALISPMLLGAPAREVSASPEAGGAGRGEPGGEAAEGSKLFWGALAAATLLLLFLIARLVRRPSAPA